MKIIKKENGSILLQTDSGELRTLSKFAVLEADGANEVIVKQGQGQWDSVFLGNLETQIEPAAAIPFEGDVNDLILFLSENFFFDVSGGEGDTPIYLGEFANQPTGTPVELSYYFCTTVKDFFFSDLVRGKWLSFQTISETVGSQINLSVGSYFRISGVAMSPTVSGVYLTRPSTLVGYTFSRQNSAATKIWIYQGITIPPLATSGAIEINLFNNLLMKDDSLDVDFSPSIIIARNATAAYGGGLMSQPVLTLLFKYSFPFI